MSIQIADPARVREVFSDDVLFAKTFLHILNKDMQIVPLHYNRVQLHYLKHRTQYNIIVKPRQIGFSTLIQSGHIRECITNTTSALTMADTDANTAKLRRISQRFYDLWPAWMSKPPRNIANAVITQYPHTSSMSSVATAGSQSSGRGDTCVLFHGSEVAYWKNAEWVMSGAMQSVARNERTRIELESTANGAQGWFYEEVQRALAGKSIFKPHFYAWWWDVDYRLPLEPGEIIEYTDDEMRAVNLAKKEGFDLTDEQIKWRRDKSKELGWMFRQEYPESINDAFIVSGKSVFGNISHARMAPTATKCYKSTSENVAIGSPYVPGHRYTAGLDWGQSDDYTALSIFDATVLEEVYIARWNNMEWGDMRQMALEACAQYHVETLQPEQNSASSNIENLFTEAQELGLDITIRPFQMTNLGKQQIVNLFYTGLHEENLRVLDVDFANSELSTFAQKQTATGLYTYGHIEGAHDDTVIARLLAVDAIGKMIW